MTLYNYKARGLDGAMVEGTLEALDKGNLERILSHRGLFLEKASKASASKTGTKFVLFHNRARMLFEFNRDLLALLQSGMTIAQALETLSSLASEQRIVLIVHSIQRALTEGKPLGQALVFQTDHLVNKSAWPFSETYIAAIKASEQSGELTQTLTELNSLLSSDQEVKAKWQKALVYPIMLVVILVCILGLMFTFVIPRFAEIYEDLNVPLPALTNAVLFVHQNILLILACFFGLICFAWLTSKTFLNTNTGRNIKAGFLSRIPVFGTLIRQRAQLETLMTLTCLTSAGLPFQSAVQQVADSASLSPLFKPLNELNLGLSKGQDAVTILKEINLFDRRRVAIIGTGLKSSNLVDRLRFATKDLQAQYNRRIDSLTTLAEPFMLLIVGSVVGMILIAIYLPIFGLSALVG